MAESHQREFPAGTKRITTGCQYCAVGCGYNAFLVPEPSEGSTPVTLDGVARFITPAMRGEVNFRGKRHLAAVAPDVRCDLNKGNHSVRGGSQGHNLVSHDGSGRSTQARLKSPHVRLTDGNLHEITWAQLNQILAKLIVAATQMSATPATAGDRKVKVDRPQGLGVKICEYQYLENAYAATKLFYSAIGTPNVAYHDRPSAAGSSPGLQDVGLGPHNFSYGEVNRSDVLLFVGTNPYENQSVFFMQYCAGHEMIVIDPRRTATAQYALETGGLHLQPTALGADSLVMYAICRELLLRWRTSHGTLDSFPWRDRVLADLGQLPTDDDDAQQRAEKRRRASRTATFDGFAKFLGVDDAESRYALSNAADVSGIPLADLHDAVDRLLKLNAARDEQPKVGIFYEKGMIWGFNYHNTASVGSLGLLLGAYSEPGRFVGRVGGHQKGWAASRMDLSGHFISSNTSDPTGYSQGFPFRNATDEFTDVALQAKFGVNASIQVHHNLDNHLFGPSPTDVLSSVGDRVTLRNGLTTNADPDVRLLWIIGGNYLGQTNDSGRKVDALNTRLRCGRNYGVIERSTSTDVNEIVGVLQQRVESPNGIVLIHQDVFENPTTEFCDLVIPAAGWGEDTFCRYNAQRRLKLYERFQDMPIHAEDRQRVDGHDPLDHCRFDHPDRLMKSPQPDWVIFRDVAHAIGQEIDSQSTDTDFQQRMRDVFDWHDSSAVCDDMAQNSNRKSLLGDLVDYAKALQLDPRRGLVHQVLGKGGDDARAEHLVNTYEVADSDSEVHGNGIASNGVMLPVTFDRPSQRLIGKLRVPPAADALLTFVKAPWPEIEPAFRRINESSGHEDELLMTNGRFNHLWNNMFHHLRNDYVNERYPEDMPGTIVELNPDWAATRNIKNGDVVEISGVSAGSTGQCRAVASLQDSVPPTCGFAMFSYPARDTGGRRFVLDGYINRTTDGYTDGINPIAALKYGRVIVRATGTSYASQTRSGPTYAQRNRIRPQNVMPRRIDSKARREWMMRELIVKKGLPQAFLRRPFDFAGNTPHQATSLAGEPSTGRFWRELDVSPSEFLALEIEGESVQSELVARLNSDLPSGMLPPATEPHTPNDTARVDRIQQLLAGTFGEAEFDELRNLLDDFLDRPHRVIEQLFLDPDAFLAKLNAADAVREQFAMRLNPSDDRTMIWRDATGVVIDQWISSERDIAFSWLNGDTMPNRKPSFRLHIRPMFTDNDISSMNPWFDLSNLEDVKANAAGIVERLEDKDLGRVMPPRPDRGTGPWPEEWIRLFKRWVSEGFPE